MKAITVEIDIDLPRDRVIELFDNTDNPAEVATGTTELRASKR